MDVDAILAEERRIWGPPELGLAHVAILLGKIVGDVCLQVRQSYEGRYVSRGDVEREFGNLITSTVRFADDLGFDVHQCIERAFDAQRAYRAARTPDNEPEATH